MTQGRRFAKVAEVRVPHSALLAVVAAALATAALVYLTRSVTFHQDEWNFIVDRPGWTMDSLFRPHNEHWSTVPVVIYKVLLALVGIRNHLPYMVVLELLHGVASLSLFALIRTKSGDLLALLGMSVFLLNGLGLPNLFWAFQIGWVASVATGIAAWLAVQPSLVSQTRALVSAGLLVISLASSGIGLFFLLVVLLRLAFDASVRSRGWCILPPVLAYAWWFVFFGRPYGDFERP